MKPCASPPAEAMAIMEGYRKADSPFVFPFLHTYQRRRGAVLTEESVLRRINRQAKLIGQQAGLSIPLTTYVMRHTWAMLMLEPGRPVELIGQCLGHTSVLHKSIYLKLPRSLKREIIIDTSPDVNREGMLYLFV